MLEAFVKLIYGYKHSQVFQRYSIFLANNMICRVQNLGLKIKLVNFLGLGKLSIRF